MSGTFARRNAIASLYQTLGETLLIFAFVNTLLAGTIACGVVYNSARIALSERGHELASLRVLGFTQGEVGYILLGELALQTLVAIPLGFLFGRLMCQSIARTLSPIFIGCRWCWNQARMPSRPQ